MEEAIKNVQTQIALGFDKVLKKHDASGIRGGSAVGTLPAWHYLNFTGDVPGPIHVGSNGSNVVIPPSTGGFLHDVRRDFSIHNLFVARAERQKVINQQEDKKSSKLQQACAEEVVRNANGLNYNAAVSVIKLPDEIGNLIGGLTTKLEELREKPKVVKKVELSEVAKIAEIVAHNASEASMRARMEVKEARRRKKEAEHAAFCSRSIPLDRKKKTEVTDFDSSKAAQTSTLDLTIIQAYDLPTHEIETTSKTLIGTHRPRVTSVPPYAYVVLSTELINNSQARGGESAYFRTATLARNSNPRWSETLELQFPSLLVSVTAVVLEVYYGKEPREQSHTPAYNRTILIEQDDAIGKVTIPLKDFIKEVEACEYPYGKVEPAHLVGSLRNCKFPIEWEVVDGVNFTERPGFIEVSAQLIGEWPNTQGKGPRPITTLKLPVRDPIPDPVPTRLAAKDQTPRPIPP